MQRAGINPNVWLDKEINNSNIKRFYYSNLNNKKSLLDKSKNFLKLYRETLDCVSLKMANMIEDGKSHIKFELRIENYWIIAAQEKSPKVSTKLCTILVYNQTQKDIEAAYLVDLVV